MTMMDSAAVTVAWSARPCTGQGLLAALDFFTEPDFYFRTALPDQLSEAEIVQLLGDSARLLLADSEPVGLWVVDCPSAISSHYELHFRLRRSAPDEWWGAAYQQIVAAQLWRNETVRVTVPAFEFDSRLPRILRALGLAYEGLLSGVVLYRGRRYGLHYFAQLWVDESPRFRLAPSDQEEGYG
jgi:hypothetical protein